MTRAERLAAEFPEPPEHLPCHDCDEPAELRLDDGTCLCEPCTAQRRIFIPDLRARVIGTVQLTEPVLVEVDLCVESEAMESAA